MTCSTTVFLTLVVKKGEGSVEEDEKNKTFTVMVDGSIGSDLRFSVASPKGKEVERGTGVGRKVSNWFWKIPKELREGGTVRMEYPNETGVRKRRPMDVRVGLTRGTLGRTRKVR